MKTLAIALILAAGFTVEVSAGSLRCTTYGGVTRCHDSNGTSTRCTTYGGVTRCHSS